MRARYGLHSPVVWVSALVVLLLDQMTKWWALRRLADGSTVDLVGSLRFRLTFNSGMAFSAGSGSGPLIGLLAIVIVAVVLWTAHSMRSRSQLLLVGLVVGGALGNVIDRLFRAKSGFMSGYVVDFIDLQWWPVFNVADAAIVVGGIMLVLVSFTADQSEPGVGDEPGDASRVEFGDRAN